MRKYMNTNDNSNNLSSNQITRGLFPGKHSHSMINIFINLFIGIRYIHKWISNINEQIIYRLWIVLVKNLINVAINFTFLQNHKRKLDINIFVYI